MNLFKTIQTHILDFESQLYTSLPAVVDAFDPTEGTANIQLGIDQLSSSGVASRIPLLERVPVVFPSVAGSAITFPLAKGDKVLVHFSKSNMDNFLTQPKDDFKSSVTPRTNRSHSLNDCFITIGVRGYDDTPVKREGTFDIYFNDTRVTINEDGSLELEVKNEDSGVDSNIDIKEDGEISITNNKESSSVTLKANGDIAGVTKSKFSVDNGTVELVDAISRLADEVSKITVNTMYGITPINNKAAVTSIKGEIDSMKV